MALKREEDDGPPPPAAAAVTNQFRNVDPSCVVYRSQPPVPTEALPSIVCQAPVQFDANNNTALDKVDPAMAAEERLTKHSSLSSAQGEKIICYATEKNNAH